MNLVNYSGNSILGCSVRLSRIGAPLSLQWVISFFQNLSVLRVSSSPMIIRRQIDRVIITFNLWNERTFLDIFSSAKNIQFARSLLTRAFLANSVISPFVRTVEIIIIGLSCPWNTSAVPMGMPSNPFSWHSSEIIWHCFLYGDTTPISLRCTGRPFHSVFRIFVIYLIITNIS